MEYYITALDNVERNLAAARRFEAKFGAQVAGASFMDRHSVSGFPPVLHLGDLTKLDQELRVLLMSGDVRFVSDGMGSPCLTFETNVAVGGVEFALSSHVTVSSEEVKLASVGGIEQRLLEIVKERVK